MSKAQCQRCKGTKKLYSISAKYSDLYSHVHLGSTAESAQYEGYVPDWIGEYGDYVQFTICRHCGQVQGEWPGLDKSINQFKSGKAS